MFNICLGVLHSDDAIILIVELSIISDLHSIRADLYYYSEQKSDFDD